MAEKQPTPKESDWVEGTRFYKASSRRREKPRCTSTSTGSWSFNTEATADFQHCARAREVSPASSLMRYLINPAEGKVGFYPTSSASDTAVSVRRYSKGGSDRITFIHPGPFDEYPELRPLTRVKCDVAIETNPHDGLPMVTVAVRAGRPFPVRSRPKKDQQAAASQKSDAKSGKQPNPKSDT